MRRPWLSWCVAALAGLAAAQTAEQRARQIILPDREIRDQSVTDILALIAEESVQADPEGVGVNIVIRDDPAGCMANRRLTLMFRAMTVERALQLIASAAALQLQFEPNAVIVSPSRRTVGPTTPEKSAEQK